MAPASSAPARPAPSRRPTGVLVVLLLCGVSFAISQTVVIPALPALAEDLDASRASVSWILTGFLVSASIATPIVGKLGDLYGKGRVLTVVMLMFSAGGVINALANSVEVVIAGRVLQGAAAGVFPLAFGIVRDEFPPDRVPEGLGIISAIFGIGGGDRPPALGRRRRPRRHGLAVLDQPHRPARRPGRAPAHPAVADAAQRTGRLAGAAVLSLALAAILLGVSEADDWGWGSALNVGLIGGGVVLGALFLRIESRTAEPLIDLEVLRRPAVAATNLTGFLVGMAMFSTFLLIPQFAQAPERLGYGFGSSVSVAGLLMVPAAAAQLVAGPMAGRLGTRIGFRTVLAAGALLTAGSGLCLAVAHDHEWEILVAGGLLGAGISCAFAAMANIIVAAVPQSEVGIATGINTVMRTVGGAFGSAIAVAILSGDTIAGGLPSRDAYVGAFIFSAVCGLIAFGAALLVPRTADVHVPVEADPARAGA